MYAIYWVFIVYFIISEIVAFIQFLAIILIPICLCTERCLYAPCCPAYYKEEYNNAVGPLFIGFIISYFILILCFILSLIGLFQMTLCISIIAFIASFFFGRVFVKCI